MKTKIKYLLLFSLGFLLLFSSACKRKSLEEPSPFGPSTISILLKVSASPNVIFAGNNRQSTTITAALKKYNGIPLADKTLYFEIGNAAGAKVELGYFEGNELVKTLVTDENGVASVVYHGPLATEITENVDIYIWVTLSSEGKDFIVDTAPISVIRDVPEAFLSLSLIPNVLFAGERRETATATAILKKFDGTPLAYQKLLFEVLDETGSKANAGYFKGKTSVKQTRTDASGRASVIYVGPLASEITANTTVYIWASYTQEGSALKKAETDFVQTNSPLLIIRDVTDITLELYADPNVLNATDKRPKAEIRAVAKKVDGVPLVKRKVYFTILSGPGKFSNNRLKIVKKTNKKGIASIIYKGPTRSELGYEQIVTIQAHLETSTPDYIHKEVDIRLKLDFK